MQTHLKRNLLARAVALALLGGTTLPMAGYAATIQGQVFMDANNNGSFDTCEAPYAGTIVYIKNNVLNENMTVTTDDNGQYQSNTHGVGSHTIRAKSPSYYHTQTVPVAAAWAVPYHFNVANANDVVNIDFGFYNPNETPNSAPVVTVPATTVTVNVGNEVNFSATMQDADGDAACVVTWTFGDGTTAEGMNATHIYGQVGTYTATITVTDTRGAVGTAQVTVTVENNPPVIEDITAEPTPVPVCEAVSLTSRITDNPGDVITATWQLGDDNTAEGDSITHTYTAPGIYDVMLTAMDNHGASSTDTITVTVNNALPVAEAGNNVEVEVNAAVNFDGSFTDADACDAHTVQWDFGDNHTANTLNPTHSYTQPGIYVAILTVTDKFGAQSTDIITVTVKNTPPVIEAISATPDTVQICEAISFSGQATDTPDDALTYGWTFGDGNKAAGQNVTHTYAEPGSYDAIMDVTDSFGGTDSATVTVTVNNTQPTVEAGDDQETSINTEVSFNGSFEDADSCDTHTISWDFGDGNTVTDTLAPTHTYTEKGSHTVTLTITDKFGGMSTDTLTVTVAGLPPVVEWAEDSIAVDVSQDFEYVANITDPDGDGGDYTVEILYGEGGHTATSKIEADIGTDPHRYSHEYAFNDSGEFPVTIRVTGEDGTGSDTMMVTVRGINVSACAPGVATVTSQTGWGDWVNPRVWSTGQVPGENDFVRIQAGHEIVLPEDLSAVNAVSTIGLCVEEGGILRSYSNALGLDPSWTSLQAATIHNKGIIAGSGGVKAGMYGPYYKRATNSSPVLIFSHQLINDATGQIISWPGGNDRPYDKALPHKSNWDTKGGHGGHVEIQPNILDNKGEIAAGDGGNAYNNSYTAAHDTNEYHPEGHDGMYVIGTTHGGNGGDLNITTLEPEISNNTGIFKAGCGGNAFGTRNPSSHVEEERTFRGIGGNVTANFGTNDGEIEVCNGNLAWWDPPTLRAGGTSVIQGGNHVKIAGGENATIDLTDLGTTASSGIFATKSIDIAVGKGGTINLPPVDRGAVFKSKRVTLYTDHLRVGGQAVEMDKAVAAIGGLVEADTIEVKPAQILYHVTLFNAEHIVGEPGETVSVHLTLNNGGPTKDSYKLDVIDSEGWGISALPDTVNVNSLRRGELSFEVTLPTTRGLENVLTVTATSEGDPNVKATTDIRLGVIEEERFDGRDGTMADVSIVIDAAMMTGKKQMIADALENIKASMPSDADLPTIELITFSDVPRTRIVTDNFDYVAGRIDSIRPIRDYTCSSMSVEAIEYALANLDPNGSKQIVLATASQPGKEAAEAIAKAKEQGVSVHIVATGMCSGEATRKAVYEDITESTGGILGWMSNASREEMQHAFTGVMDESIPTPPPVGPCQNCQASGVLKDVDGNPIADAVVQVKDTTTGEVVAETITDVNGDWTVTLPEEGEHIVSVSKDKYAFPEVLVEVGDGQSAKVVIGPEAKIKPTSALTVDFRPIGYNNRVMVGADKTYVAMLTNIGSEEAVSIVFMPQLNPKMTLVSLDAVEGSFCDNMRCDLPNLAPGESVRVEFTAKAMEVGKITNTVRIETDNYPASQKERWTVIKAPLSISITDSQDPVQMQSALSYDYQITLDKDAPATARDVWFRGTLPARGTSITDVRTEKGACDVTSEREVICQLGHLMPGESTNVTVDVQLAEPRLLMSFARGTVETENYPAHTAQERTNIVTNGEVVDVAIVIDATVSMEEERAGMLAAIDNFIATNPDFNQLVALIEFKDEVKLTRLTRDLRDLRRAVANLEIGGGGTCPEASVEALNIALDHLRDGGLLVLLTDADPYKDADVKAVAKRIETKGVVFDGHITGSCSDVNDGSMNKLNILQ